MISNNRNVSNGIVDCSLYTSRVPLKDDTNQEKMAMFRHTRGQSNFFANVAKAFIIPTRQNHFIQKTVLALLQVVVLPLQ